MRLTDFIQQEKQQYTCVEQYTQKPVLRGSKVLHIEVSPQWVTSMRHLCCAHWYTLLAKYRSGGRHLEKLAPLNYSLQEELRFRLLAVKIGIILTKRAKFPFLYKFKKSAEFELSKSEKLSLNIIVHNATSTNVKLCLYTHVCPYKLCKSYSRRSYANVINLTLKIKSIGGVRMVDYLHHFAFGFIVTH